MQAAFDINNPNGTGRRRQGERVLHIFRLYRKLAAPPLGEFTSDGGVLDTIRGGIRTAREFIRGSLLRPLQGRILEREVQVVLIAEGVEELPEVRSSLTYVADGVPGENVFIDVPFRNAKGVTHIRLTYRTFWTPIRVNGVWVDGDANLVDLQRLFDDYLYPPGGGTAADFELYWLNLNAPVSAQDPFGASEWLIHPLRHLPRTRQSAQRPFTRFAAVEFVGLRNTLDLAKAEDGLLSSPFGLDTLTNLLEWLELEELVGLLEDVFGTVDEFIGLLEDVNSVVVAVQDLIAGVAEFIALSVAKVRAILVAVQEIIGRVENAVDALLDLPNFTADQLRLIQQDLPGLVEDPDSGVLLTGALRRTRDLLLALLADPSKFQPRLAGAPRLPRTVAVQVPAGTTIERLARDTNTSVSALIEANGLQYPFIDARERPAQLIARLEAERDGFAAHDQARVDAGLPPRYTAQLAGLADAIAAAAADATARPARPNVLYAGELLRVPEDRPEGIPSVVGIDGSRLNLIAAATQQPVTEDERLFGIDFYLSPEGNLEWDADRRDLRLDRGLDHMQHVLERYMRLPLGALRFAPAIGNFAFANLGRAQTLADNRLLAYAIYRTEVQDPRVRTVRNVRAESHAGAAFVLSDAELINGRALPELRLPVGAAVQ